MAYPQNYEIWKKKQKYYHYITVICLWLHWIHVLCFWACWQQYFNHDELITVNIDTDHAQHKNVNITKKPNSTETVKMDG